MNQIFGSNNTFQCEGCLKLKNEVERILHQLSNSNDRAARAESKLRDLWKRSGLGKQLAGLREQVRKLEDLAPDEEIPF